MFSGSDRVREGIRELFRPANARAKLRGQGPRAEATAAQRPQQIAPRLRREGMSAGGPPATFALNEALQRRAEAGPRQLECDSCAALPKTLARRRAKRLVVVTETRNVLGETAAQVAVAGLKPAAAHVPK